MAAPLPADIHGNIGNMKNKTLQFTQIYIGLLFVCSVYILLDQFVIPRAITTVQIPAESMISQSEPVESIPTESAFAQTISEAHEPVEFFLLYLHRRNHYRYLKCLSSWPGRIHSLYSLSRSILRK